MMKTFLPLTAFLLAFAVCAGEATVEVKVDHPDAVYRCNEPIILTAQVMQDGKVLPGRKVNYEILGDGGIREKGQFVSAVDKPFEWKRSFAFPAAMRAEFVLLDENGKPIPLPRKQQINQKKYVGGMIGAVVEPEKILPERKRPADFDEFWQKQLAENAKVPMKLLEKKPVKTPRWAEGKVNVWDVKISCVTKRPVSGYLAIPVGAKPKSLPAILFVQGAGAGSCLNYTAADYAQHGAIVLDINAHGILNGQPKSYYEDLYKKKEGELFRYYSKVYETRESHYFLGIVLRLMRALEYLRSLPEWNGRDLVITGASQGGWQALVGAALDPHITLCCAGVPAFADFDSEFGSQKRMKRIHFGGTIARAKKGDEFIQKSLAVQAYYDTVHFAPLIKAETHISVGYLDVSSPTTSVYAIYNSIPATTKKQITAYPAGVHGRARNVTGRQAIEELCRKRQKEAAAL